jgi:hypothetical protein
MKDSIKWSKDPKEATKQIPEAFGILGFDFPTTEHEVIAYDKMFDGFPYQCDPKNIDPHKILNDLKIE